MKKLMLIAALMLISIGVSAQDNRFAIGGNVGVGVYRNSYTPFGFGPKFQMYFTKQLRGEASFNWWTKKDDLGFWDVNANVHYVFNVGRNINVYPLGGLTVVSTHGLPDGYDNQSMVGFNLGGGAEFFIAPQLKLTFEMKYQYAEKEEDITIYDMYGTKISSGHYKYEAEGPVFQAGFAYCF